MGVADFELDICAEVCPMTFVRTKLLLERMVPGQTANIRLRGSEPVDNVPRAVRDHGHEVLSLTPLEGGVYELVIRRR
ncbi:MAG TPA: sulfurtransferase TusA family protein [Geminicoccaceae bacterium]|nr:sulfurtransferase TusA family protein [Geminicoccus sp.]HMU48701.1 sulfurtransferase TusA family protein [Geminicoccaceae bacterium]